MMRHRWHGHKWPSDCLTTLLGLLLLTVGGVAGLVTVFWLYLQLPR